MLDTLLIRLHTETACRRGGALVLRPADLDSRYCRVLLREKGGTYRWQPITPTLMAALAQHATGRGATDPGDVLLRQANGAALTTRRYDLLWTRVRAALPWAAQLGVSSHWLRHTHLHPQQHPRNRHRTGHPHRRTPPTGHRHYRWPHRVPIAGDQRLNLPDETVQIRRPKREHRDTGGGQRAT